MGQTVGLREAYAAEQQHPKGQAPAGQSIGYAQDLGLSYFKALRLVVLPVYTICRVGPRTNQKGYSFQKFQKNTMSVVVFDNLCRFA